VENHPEMKRPLYHLPHYKGVTGRAARFVKYVAEVKRAEIRKTHMKRRAPDKFKARSTKSEMMAS
jgi:hypothetical protein